MFPLDHPHAPGASSRLFVLLLPAFVARIASSASLDVGLRAAYCYCIARRKERSDTDARIDSEGRFFHRQRLVALNLVSVRIV